MEIIRRIKLEDGTWIEDRDGYEDQECLAVMWDGNPENEPTEQCMCPDCRKYLENEE